MEALGYLSRAGVAAALLASAAWKARQPGRFYQAVAAVQGLPPAGWPRVPPRLALGLALAAEGLAAGLLLLPAPWGRAGALLALTLLAAFTAALARAPHLPGGCGCWRGPAGRTPPPWAYLLRNALLSAGAVAGAALPAPPPAPAAALLLLPPACLAALLVLELPSVLAVLGGR